MKKRDFLKNLSLAVLGPSYINSALVACADEAAETPVNVLSSKEDFWLKVRGDYKLKPDYISVTYGAGGTSQSRTVEITKRIKNINS